MCDLGLKSLEGEWGKGGGSVKRRVRSGPGGRRSARKVFPVKEETIREAVQAMKGRRRAVHNLNVFRRITFAIGKFYLAKLNCRRSKELCAAEVKRGLRKYRTKTENYVIPVVKNPHRFLFFSLVPMFKEDYGPLNRDRPMYTPNFVLLWISY